MHFITFNFKQQLNFTNMFNETKFMVECLTVLIFYHARPSFDFVPPFWRELELKKTLLQRNIMAMKAIIRKPVQTDVDVIHVQLTRTKKMTFHAKYHVLINHSQDYKIGSVLCQEY